MKLTNSQIATHVRLLKSAFADAKQYLPIKLNFAIQKNAQTLETLTQEIEKARLDILIHYGKVDSSSGIVTVPEEAKPEALKEINELYEIEQEVSILSVNIDSFGDLSLSMEQMNAIMFMIEEG